MAAYADCNNPCVLYTLIRKGAGTVGLGGFAKHRDRFQIARRLCKVIHQWTSYYNLRYISMLEYGRARNNAKKKKIRKENDRTLTFAKTIL